MEKDALDLTHILLGLFIVTGSSFVGTLLYIGRGVTGKLDLIEKTLTQMGETMHGIKADLKEELSKHSTRIAVLENEMKNVPKRKSDERE